MTGPYEKPRASHKPISETRTLVSETSQNLNAVDNVELLHRYGYDTHLSAYGYQTADLSTWTGPPPDEVVFIKALVSAIDGPAKVFRGRLAWCLANLLNAGNAGITSLRNPAPRLADYIFKLRKAGLVIDTEGEPHGGHYAGRHGRYRLKTSVIVLQVRGAGDVP